ncbi:hypothetical protein Gorai_006472 [Gossypium raimondii]|uniref:Uncharacterized protein n=1 Tax=Gossypium raimondii TaxID=29730 RepID=A0A7J8QFL7_GOSRA|nr:hypothetical protein [Gossypium raimondii]
MAKYGATIWVIFQGKYGIRCSAVPPLMESGIGSPGFAAVQSFTPMAFASLKTHRLLPFVEKTIAVLPKLIIGEDGVFLENSAFAQYEKQDSTLLVWLLSIVSWALQNQLIGSPSSAAKLWEALTQVLGTQTTTKVMRSRFLLHFKKKTLSMSVYLTEIKHLCDFLVGCGHHISLAEQQSTILNGLAPKFDHVVLIIITS